MCDANSYYAAKYDQMMQEAEEWAETNEGAFDTCVFNECCTRAAKACAMSYGKTIYPDESIPEILNCSECQEWEGYPVPTKDQEIKWLAEADKALEKKGI